MGPVDSSPHSLRANRIAVGELDQISRTSEVDSTRACATLVVVRQDCTGKAERVAR